MMRKIGILTSGGDAPGMNAAVRAVVRTAQYCNVGVMGIMRGYHGLIRNEIFELNPRSVADVIHRGGTILKSARSMQFKTPEGQDKAVKNLNDAGIEGLVVIGGDGSFQGALALQSRGIKIVGIPGTIDNDIPCTDYTIGFDTAINTVVDAINKIRDTATSHERVYVVEVMGRNSGYIALYAGLAGGAESILIPEIPTNLDDIVQRIHTSYELGKAHSIIVVAEGYSGDPEAGRDVEHSAAFRVGSYVKDKTGFETRVTILGHIQRGGNPTVMDRILASRMGEKAVRLLVQDKSGFMVGITNNQITAVNLEYALAQEKQVDLGFHELAHMLSST